VNETGDRDESQGSRAKGCDPSRVLRSMSPIRLDDHTPRAWRGAVGADFRVSARAGAQRDSLVNGGEGKPEACDTADGTSAVLSVAMPVGDAIPGGDSRVYIQLECRL
jgi:hypothetical protein